ncbi:hypothetical protein LZQ00_06185 [Sphingobacterium sp. SRCM116780]|uniref:hypothetical protein n=1 Tax=Sphingobacterium sp. SRCM116780 TaxID=2907623 RepID=UPI001F3FB774|nr:hypothetical protein [Sphingobacterium sp. SRCM116780]UIR57402.1 hypothetical protein LZQ00_06185 [Sphingobacterium sp. SRCM116780]
MEEYKHNVIKQYIKNNLNMTPDRQELLFKRVERSCQIQKALKYQELESEGPGEEGRIWLSTEGMAHSYYYNKTKGTNCGTQIWKKNELMLFSSSLSRGEYRNNYIQMLEPGTVLSMSYKEILAIRGEFPEVASHLEHISNVNEQAFQHRIRLLNEASVQRIIQFEEENPLFCNIASVCTKAMHVGLTRQGYSLLKKKILEKRRGKG